MRIYHLYFLTFIVTLWLLAFCWTIWAIKRGRKQCWICGKVSNKCKSTKRGTVLCPHCNDRCDNFMERNIP